MTRQKLLMVWFIFPDKCTQEPEFCLNGGTCEPAGTSVRCHCPDRYQGDRCDNCTERFQGDCCQECVMGFQGDECDTCAYGYYGDTCGKAQQSYRELTVIIIRYETWKGHPLSLNMNRMLWNPLLSLTENHAYRANHFCQ